MRGAAFLERARNGMSPRSLVTHKLGRTSTTSPRIAGVVLEAPDVVAAWDITMQISGGEYAYAGLTPRPGDRVVDVGANIGVFSLWASHLGASVVAYEPGPDAFDALVSNVAGKDVVPVHAAIVGRLPDSGSVRLYLHGERSTRNTLLGHEIGSGEPLAAHVDVRAVAIDEALQDGCDLLKIDCEGAEFEILAAASDDDLRNAERIVLEFHRSAGEPTELLDRLRDAGFDCAILEGADPDAPFGVLGGTRRG